MEKDKITIREINDNDVKEVSNLIIKNLTEINSKDYSKKIIKMLVEDYSPKFIKEKIKNGKMIVAEKDGNVVGVGRFFNGEIFDIFVLPKYHNQGIGKRIMAELERIAVSSGYKKVFLPASKTSIGFYKKLNYKLDNTHEKSKSSYWMSKDLKLLANLEFRNIKKDEFHSAMKLLDKELKIRVRTNKFLFEKFRKFRELFIGVFLDNEIIGLICGFPRENYVLISEISVDERFQNRGFGKRLIKLFEEKAKAKYNQINVGAMDNAVNFYESLNYKSFLLIQFKKSDYLPENFKHFKILKEKDYNDDVNLEVKIEKPDLKIISNLRKKYPKACFQYIFTKTFK